ncbi:MAG: universal stress protein, partial [Deltaproteobacteria bacterium]|nr:universal stress protein [Deltaproteobacteria bacterium]
MCPTDFSEPAFTALKRAEELARHFAAELIVAHVIPPLPGPHSFPDPQASLKFDVPLFQQELAIKAEDMLKNLVSHHKAETRDLVATGEAAPEILRIAQQ